MTILALDFGLKKIGMAYSDETELLAAPLETLRNNSLQEAMDKVLKIAEQMKAHRIVMGYPTSILNKETEETRLLKKFQKELAEKADVQVDFWDESYSTQQAEAGAHGRKKANADSEAARIILQEYLDFQNERRKNA